MAKLLLIEDEKILRENICELLEIYGYKCITACHGMEGLEKALTEKPDLIICDIMLPYLTGFQVKAALNKLNGLALIPLIFLSAKAGRNDLRQGMDLGAADYITKPFQITELISSVKSRLAQSEHIQSLVNTRLVSSLNDFILLFKHECNTPLNGIINFSALLALKYPDQPEFFGKAVKAINTSGKRLYKTISNILDLLQLRYITPLTAQHIPTREISRMITRILAERTTHYGYDGKFNINFNCPGALQIHQENLEVILFEVIDNVFKFSSAGSPVIDVCSGMGPLGKEMVLHVTNPISDLLTFSEDDIGLFRQFNRDEQEQQGSGLGLFLLKTIIEKYQGSVRVSSYRPETIQVTLTFPLLDHYPAN